MAAAMGGMGRSEDTLASLRRVLGHEAEALRRLSAELDPKQVNFALDLLYRVSGRVIVTGMGKSGHIARKIAATLASTGTPSQFVHPAEASHGDLGMVTARDAVIALSNSGETTELADIIGFTRRWSIPLIAITGKLDSALGSAADAVLLLAPVGEAGLIGLAPTSSTTMMLALGDALAVALLERRGFSAEDFHQLHPGGRLGQRLIRVADLMHSGRELPLIDRAASMADAILEMSTKTFGCVGALDDQGRLVGIVTDGDLRRHMGGGLLEQRVADVMTASPRTIRPSALAAEALHLMNEKSITTLFVIENERPVGIVRMHDCLRSGVA
jgi:arabinose-5-phosphate isomerase